MRLNSHRKDSIMPGISKYYFGLYSSLQTLCEFGKRQDLTVYCQDMAITELLSSEKNHHAPLSQES